MLDNAFNRDGNNASHVTNRLKNESFYGLGSADMLYPGATPDVQDYLYACICQPTLSYGLECMSSSAMQMRCRAYIFPAVKSFPIDVSAHARI